VFLLLLYCQPPKLLLYNHLSHWTRVKSICVDSVALGQRFPYRGGCNEACTGCPIVPALLKNVYLIHSPRTDFDSLSENRIGQPLHCDFTGPYEAYMKKNQFQNLSRFFIGILLCVIFSSAIALGQRVVVHLPSGEAVGYDAPVTVNASNPSSPQPYAIVQYNSWIAGTYYPYRNLESVFESSPIAHWLAPGKIVAWAGITSYSINAVSAQSHEAKLLKVAVLNSSNSIGVYILDFTKADAATPPTATLLPPIQPKGGYYESWVKLVGDATYVLSTSFLYVYRDSVTSWRVDSTGLGGAIINDISLDTAQYVYAATTNGVFKQHPDSNVWHPITNLPINNFSNILVDRRDDIFAANYVSYNGKGTYVSTNNGSSWTLDSAGIGTLQILKLSDDAYGNTYAIANGYYQIYRRINNTPGWTRIDGGINAITVNPTTINSVGGDSVLLAATSFGLFASTDQGTTWSEDNANNPATSFYSFAKGAGGKWFTTTNLAMYSLNPGDTAWTKVFPTSGYLGQLPIYTDGLDNIYTFGAGNSNLLQPLYKSSNGGTSWALDTAGSSLVWGGGAFYIDEKGGQHASYDPDGSFCRLYTKPYGGSWGQDTAGFGLTSAFSYSYTETFASDHHGYLYASGYYFNGSTRVTGQVIRRPIDGGTWEADTVGIPSAYNHCTALVPGKNGDMYAVFPPFLLHRSNSGTWSNINVPVITGSTHNSMALSVDSSGALFAAISGDDVNFHYRGLGVYFSKDTGATWTFAGGDSIGFTKLVSYGDSTYACSGNGLYIFTRTAFKTTGVTQVRGLPTNYALFQNYPNPFNPTTVISFQLAAKSRVTLKVYDILGREVETLVDGASDIGLHQVSFDASRFASGIYFYRIQAGGFMATKKLLLLK